MVCKCFDTRKQLVGWADADTPIYGETYGVCLGTKEIDHCSCHGNESYCDFYPNVRKVARERKEKEEEDKKQKNIEELKQMFQHLADFINKQNNEVQSM